MDDAHVGDIDAGAIRESLEVGDPGIDHLGLRLRGELVDGELGERPGRVAIRAAADLEDQSLSALSGEGTEVVVEIVDELEVDECLDRGGDSPPLLVRGHAGRPEDLALVTIHLDHLVERPGVLSVDAESCRRCALVVPAREARRVGGAPQLGVHAGKQRELAELTRDLGFRLVPGKVARGLHVRPELGHRRHREDAPLGAFGAQPADPRQGARDDRREIVVARAHVRLARNAREPLPTAIATLVALPPCAPGDIRGGRRVALEPSECLVVYPRLRHRSDTTGTEPAVLEQPKRRELELDDAVVPPVTQRRDGQLELIADERVRAQLAQDVTAHEQVGDAEGAPLRIAHHAGRDHGYAGLHRVPRRLCGGERPRLVRSRRDPLHRPSGLEVDDHGLLEAAALLHQEATQVERAVVAR